MEEYNLINSKDVGKHCEKIRYQFNTIETAVIINRCKKIEKENTTIKRYRAMA